VVDKLVLWSEQLHVLTVHDKVLQFTLINKSRPVLFSQLFVRMKEVVLLPLNLHKCTLVAPPRMRDDLHIYLLPFYFISFGYWMYAWIEFLKSSSFSFSFNSLNLYRVSNTLCWAARPQTLDNLVFTFVSKRTPSSLTWLTFIKSISHFVFDLDFRWWDLVSDCDLAGASSSWVCHWASLRCWWVCCWPCCCWGCYWPCCRASSFCCCSDWDILLMCLILNS
jgi:hypothetical protein